MSQRVANSATIMLVGTGHWGNPGRDYRNVVFDDMLAPHRQREIQECLTRLGRFKPTKIALEVMASQASVLQAEYDQYRKGAFRLTADERHQLGFRLAAEHEHERIFGIDWHDPHREIGWDSAIAFAQEHDQHDLVSLFTSPDQSTPEGAEADRQDIRSLSVRQQLLESNDLAQRGGNHRVYMDLSQVGKRDNYIGADVVLRWYERNLKIFVNLARLATSPDDRIMVIIGAGHLPLLAHFIEGAMRFRLEPVQAHLS